MDNLLLFGTTKSGRCVGTILLALMDIFPILPKALGVWLALSDRVAKKRYTSLEGTMRIGVEKRLKGVFDGGSRNRS